MEISRVKGSISRRIQEILILPEYLQGKLFYKPPDTGNPDIR